MIRRQFLKFLSAALAAGSVPLATAATSGRRQQAIAGWLVPGYQPEYATSRGRPLTALAPFTSDLPNNHSGPTTLLTLVDETAAEPIRTLLPLKGHHLAIHPDGREAFFSTMDGETMVRLDLPSLRILRMTQPHDPDFTGGGHAVYLPDGKHLVITERRRLAAWSGDPAQHEGRISVRDANSLQVLESYPCGGIHPHDIALMQDNRHVVVSNYGRTQWPDGQQLLPHVAEPSLSVLDLQTGRMVARLVGKAHEYEIRHVAGTQLDQLIAIQTQVLAESSAASILAETDAVSPQDLSVPPGKFYAPAPPLAVNFAADPVSAHSIVADSPLATRQGQSLTIDPHYGEALITFTSSNQLAVVNLASGKIRTMINTDRLGLQHPRGVALHPDGIHYAVSGSWRGLYLFRRGSHELVRDRCRYDTFFGHSHLNVATLGYKEEAK